MAEQHTPGPWLRCGDSGLTIYALHDNGFGYWKDGKRELVNRFYARIEDCRHQGGSIEEAEANARLIAAAPEMHAALKDALQVMLWLVNYDNPREDVAIAIRKAKAALAKSEIGQ